MDRRVTGTLAAIGLAAVALGGIALAQNDTPPPSSDTSTEPNGTDQSQPPAPVDETPPDTAPEPPAPPSPAAAAKPSPLPSAKPTTTGTVTAPATAPVPDEAALAPPVPTGPPPVPANAVLLMTGLDKITGKPTQIAAPLNVPVKFATFTITARYCYSTPPSETPETSAFVQIDDHRPDQPEHRVFSGWMYASSPGLNGVEHPLYDVWVISCKTNEPGQAAAAHVAAHSPVRVGSPDAGDSEGVAPLPEGSGQ